jgi:hypothetical protein
MNLSEEFRKFAAECERIAKLTHDRENKSAWRRMSERWLQNAKSLKKDIPRQSRKTAIESALTLGLTETRARVSSPFFRYERQVDPRLPDCPQLCMQKSHRDRQARRVGHRAASPERANSSSRKRPTSSPIAFAGRQSKSPAYFPQHEDRGRSARILEAGKR